MAREKEEPTIVPKQYDPPRRGVSGYRGNVKVVNVPRPGDRPKVTDGSALKKSATKPSA